MIVNVAKDAQPAFPPLADGEALCINLDLVNPVYMAQSRNPGVTDDQIPPLGSVVLDTDEVWFVSTGRSVTCQLQVMLGARGWTPSPAQIAAQIALQGINVNVSQASFVIIPSGDSTGAKDSARLNAATPIYGAISLGPGTFYLSEPVAWTEAEIVGCGRSTIIQPGTGWTGGMLLSPGSNASIRDVYGLGGTGARSGNPAANFIQVQAGATFWEVAGIDCDRMNGLIFAAVPATGSHGRITKIRGEHNGGGLRIDGGLGAPTTAEINIYDIDIQNCETAEILFCSGVDDIRCEGPFNGSIESGAAVNGITIQGSCQNINLGAIDIGGGAGSALLVIQDTTSGMSTFSPSQIQAGPGVVQEGNVGVLATGGAARLSFSRLWATHNQSNGFDLENTGTLSSLDKCGGNENNLGGGTAYDALFGTGHWLNDGFGYESSGVTAGRFLPVGNHYTEANPPSSLTFAGAGPGGW